MRNPYCNEKPIGRKITAIRVFCVHSRLILFSPTQSPLAAPILQRYNLCYTKGMKTAISLPDELFRRAEAVARKLKISRSQLYATAIMEFIERRQAARITQHLNEIYSAEPAKIDPALASAQSKSIERESW